MMGEMMSEKMSEELDRKLKRERIETCLNCKRLTECKDIGKFEECSCFDEVDGEAWVIKKI